MALQLKTDSNTEPVELSEIKAQCRVTHDAENTLLENYGITARKWVEEYTQRSLVGQTWYLSLDRFPPGRERIYLPRPPYRQGVTITYYDTNGDSQTLTITTDFYVNNYEEPAYIVPVPDGVWPDVESDRTAAVLLEWLAGYGSSSAVPQPIKQAILMLCAHWYKFREPVETGTFVQDVPYAIEHLLGPYMFHHQIPIGALT